VFLPQSKYNCILVFFSKKTKEKKRKKQQNRKQPKENMHANLLKITSVTQ